MPRRATAVAVNSLASEGGRYGERHRPSGCCISVISLTIASLNGARVGVQIVPHTWLHTALAHARAGDAVNLEGDMIGKYVARLLAGVQHS